MKHINTIFRMLCLTAMLCMTSANASAYVVYDGLGDIILNPETMGDNRIMVVEGEVSVKNIEVYHKDYTLIILPGARVTNEFVFHGGEFYVEPLWSERPGCRLYAGRYSRVSRL